MKKIIFSILLLIYAQSILAAVWGKNYFPNVPLIDQEGKTHLFFDDLIKDKIVVINFIFTRCSDTCPLETAQLRRVQDIIDERLGKDIFFYSISIDPEHDTSAVLKTYREKFDAKWSFFTGNENDIRKIRRKLGLYIEEIQDGSNNHNINMIIGNQKTGRWMKRSPFENPYVLADQITNWLDGWKQPQKTKNYASAPELRHISDGEKLFRTRCVSCHTQNGTLSKKSIGPDLLGVTKKREQNWLIRWLKEPDVMLAEKDPIATALYAQYNNISMPNMRLSETDVIALIQYMTRIDKQHISTPKKPENDIVAVMNAWIREAPENFDINSGFMTLINPRSTPLILSGINSDAFSNIELHEMIYENGQMKMKALKDIEIPANGKITLSPGGMHLMLYPQDKMPIAGDSVKLTLHFNSGEKQVISMGVKSI